MGGATVGYARVSTNSQADHGTSLEVQRSKITAAAELADLELVRVIVDAESAKSLRRPGAAELLELVKAGEVDAVIVYSLSRLTRSVKDLGSLLELFGRHDVALVSVSESLDTSSAAGRLALNLMGAISQWEREAISERTAEALQAKRAKGERVGTVPFGYRVAADGVMLEAEPAEQRALAVLRDLRAKGYSLRQIAAELSRQGFTTRRGSPWSHQGVAHLLRAA